MTRWHKGSSRIESVGSRSCSVVVRCVIYFAIVAVAAGLLGGCGSDATQEPSKEVQTMLKDHFEAMNTGDTQAVAKSYATNAVVDNYADNGNRVEGSTAIADYFAGALKDYSLQWIAEGDTIQYGRYVIQGVSNTQIGGTEAQPAVHILDIDANDQIAHEWIIGWGR